MSRIEVAQPALGIEAGTLANRPAANVRMAGTPYFATDDNGGTVYRTDGVSTWTKVGAGASETGGSSFGVTEITTAPAGITAVGSASKVAVTGLSKTVTVGAKPIEIACWCGQNFNNTAGDGGGIGIVDTADTTTLLTLSIGHSGVANGNFTLFARRELSPTAGSHTYAVYAWAVVGGTFTLNVSTSNRMQLTVREC